MSGPDETMPPSAPPTIPAPPPSGAQEVSWVDRQLRKTEPLDSSDEWAFTLDDDSLADD